MRNVRASWLTFMAVLVPSCVCAQPAPTQTSGVADQRAADRAARAACLTQFHPTFGVDDERWRRFKNCLYGGIAPAVSQTNPLRAQNLPPVGTPSTPPPLFSAADIAQCSLGHPDPEYAKAIAACTLVIDAMRMKFGSGPEFAKVWIAFYVRGINYAAANRIPAAMADLTEVIRLRPDFALAFTARGSGYLSTGQFALAISDFDRAIELAKRMPSKEFDSDSAWGEALLFRATAHAKMGEYREAIQDYTDCKERFPSRVSGPLDPSLSKAIATVQAQGANNNSSSSNITLSMTTTLRLECVYGHSSDTGYVFIDFRNRRLTTEDFSYNVQNASFEVNGNTLSWAVTANWSYSLNVNKLQIKSSLPFPDWHCVKR